MPELKSLYGELTVDVDGVIYKLKRLSHGEANVAFKGLTTFNAATGQIDVDADALGRKRLASCIASWNLTVEGQPLPVNEENVSKIPEDHANRLLEAIRRGAAVKSDLVKK